MTFAGGVARFADKVKGRQREIFIGSVSDLRESVQDGSVVTGAPGQPVEIGTLRGAWLEQFPELWLGQVIIPESSPAAAYAEAIENGQQEPYTTASGVQVTPSEMTLRSTVGGFHSVKLTRAGWQPLVDNVVARVVGGAS